MIYYEDNCFCCESSGYPCIGRYCPNRNVKMYECDKCNEEVDYGNLFHWNGQEFCIDCIKEELEKVE